MQTLIVVLILFAQTIAPPVVGLPGYLTTDPYLVTQDGTTYQLQIGTDPGCTSLIGVPVRIYPGSGGLASLGPADDSGPVCHVFIGPAVTTTAQDPSSQ